MGFCLMGVLSPGLRSFDASMKQWGLGLSSHPTLSRLNTARVSMPGAATCISGSFPDLRP